MTKLQIRLRIELNKKLLMPAFILMVMFLFFVSFINAADWKQNSDMLHPRGEHANVVVNGKIYVFGGIHDHYYGPPYVERYDPKTDKWFDLGEWKIPRHHFTVGETLYGDEIWICGGKWGNDTTSTSRVDVYNTKTNSWRQGPSLPEKHWGGPSVIVGQYLHVLTGAVDKNTTSDHHFVLDLENESAGWFSKSAVPKPLVHAAGVELNGKIYLLGGELHHKHDGDQKTVQVYDPETDSWDLSKAELPIARSHLEWSTFKYENKIYSVCGVDSANKNERGQNEILMYDPEKDTWFIWGHLPYDMTSPGAKVIDGILYVFGGGGDDWFPVNSKTYSTQIIQ